MLEAILEMDDNDIYQYALNKQEIPDSLNNRVFTLLKDYTLL
jgi:succinate dehydrogenase flavin-adding protein (antitoxin of CptAB toxin-antitoxin module)